MTFPTAAVTPSDSLSTRQLPTVLHVRVVTGTGGGPDKTILNSPAFLSKHGYRSICAYMHPTADPGFNELCRRAAELDAPIESIPDQGPFDVSVLRRLQALCRDENVAIWHGHDYKSNLLGLLVNLRHPMRLITTVHGWGKHGPRTRFYYWIDRQCLKRYDRVLCVSDDLEQECLRHGVQRDRCRMLSNGIDIERFQRRRTTAEAKQQLGFDPGSYLVGGVGRLSKEKAFDRLIEAVSSLIDEGCDVRLAIIGEGEEHDNLQELIAGQSDPSRFRLLGYQADVIDFYQAFDVYALSSIREGLPNTLLEAMALETPIVATRIAGVPRVIEHEVNGLLVEPGDTSGLAQQIRVLLGNADRRKQLATSARSTIESRYSFETRMHMMSDIYDELLNIDDH